ncbi:hypothetical protein BB561_005275 [Smittium simulii]|uniref:Integrase catalytic domain-containing protein n=1 Tax=Smittium simulii TaxID=133385 RepID=A0A2T9YBC4_9FUNG|nr:hypothetical protein BB561_005275 [Smittium simulii]
MVLIDCARPFTATEKDDRYILVLADLFTRWVDVVAVQVVSTETTIRVLEIKLIVLLDCPQKILSDNGPVKEYKYLGVVFNNSWNHKLAIKNNSDNTKKHFLLPMATYGGELFGMSVARSNQLQRIIDNACCIVLGCGNSTALSRIRDELKIATVNIRTAVARERAYYKWPTLKTWMPEVMLMPFINRLDILVINKKRWAKRYCQDIVPGKAAKTLKLRARKNDKSKIIAWIEQIMASRIRSVGLLELVYTEYSQGIQSIIKIRVGCFNTMLKLASAKIADMASLTRTRLLGTSIGGGLVITTAGLRQLQSSTLAVSNVLSMVRYMSKIYTTRNYSKQNNERANLLYPKSWGYGDPNGSGEPVIVL